MSIEAMKEALEVLEQSNQLSIGENAIALPGEIDAAMDNLRAAIEQAEKQENECGNGAGCLYKISLIENLEEKLAAAEKRSGNVTITTLAGKLAALGLVQAEAILDPDGYDGGAQWKAIEKLLRFVKGEENEH
jgi:hypothetical protein